MSTSTTTLGQPFPASSKPLYPIKANLLAQKPATPQPGPAPATATPSAVQATPAAKTSKSAKSAKALAKSRAKNIKVQAKAAKIAAKNQAKSAKAATKHQAKAAKAAARQQAKSAKATTKAAATSTKTASPRPAKTSRAARSAAKSATPKVRRSQSTKRSSQAASISEISRLTRADLINAESALGRTLFGPIPDGHRREFFQYRNNVWIWHESWTDATGPKEATVRYEVRSDGVYKKPLGGRYTKLLGQELQNFRAAAHGYLRLIKSQLYNPSLAQSAATDPTSTAPVSPAA